MLENYYNEKELNRFRKTITKIKVVRKQYDSQSNLDIAKTMLDLRNGNMKNDEKIIHAMALADIASGKTTKKNYYDVQFMGGLALCQGKIAEMKTGEGKTLMCSLGVAANFVLGFKVHVSTANEYLAKRDQETLVHLYDMLGIKSSYNISTLSKSEKRESYKADVMYSTATEKGFDYLRDNLVDDISKKIQPLDFMHVAAIIDEADFILIDEARTPLIISGESESHPPSIYRMMREVALKLKKMDGEPEKELNGEYIYKPGDFWLELKSRAAYISEEGYDSLEREFKSLNILGSDGNLYLPANAWMIEEAMNAIRAEYLYFKDKHYVVKKAENEIIIIDENTGRLSEGRRWSDGLHQAIEAKENLEVKPENSTMRSISIQNFYRHYGKISGMTGTAKACSDEFLEVYGTLVVQIPTNKETQRKDHADKIFLKADPKYTAIIEDIEESHKNKQPILVATTSVVESEHISNLLIEKGIFHYVLNAKNHALEAQIVAQAGVAGAVTVSTSMAGRGTDIILGGNQEEIISMREKQLVRCVTLRNFVIQNLAMQNALVPGEELTGKKVDWNNMIVLEDFLNQTLAYMEAQPSDKGITHDKLLLGTLSLLEMFLNAEIKRVNETWEDERKKAIDAGGLYVLGCSRNESRRIDDQIKGRSGRQGDIGRSCFYISFDDPWLVAFAENRMINYIRNTNSDDTMIQSPMLAKVVNSTQKKFENFHYEGRKNTVKFDSVLNEARIQFFDIRDQMISGSPLLKNLMIQNTKEKINLLKDYDFLEMNRITINNETKSCYEWLDKIYEGKIDTKIKEDILIEISKISLNIDLDYIPQVFEMLDQNGLQEKLQNNEFKDEDGLAEFFQSSFDKYIENVSPEIWKFYFSQCLVSMDKAWVTFISVTDVIRESSQLSSFAQKNPVYVYKTACFEIFSDLILEFKSNLINLFMDTKSQVAMAEQRTKIEEGRRAAHEQLEAQRQLQNPNQDLAEPEEFILEIDPSLIFRDLESEMPPARERSLEELFKEKAKELQENKEEIILVEPEKFILDIETDKIFQDITEEQLNEVLMQKESS